MFLWSTTAASNDTADPAINAREGMAPSQVNDSMRALMASMAKWRDDTSGLLETAGTASAYTVSTNSTLTLVNGRTITIRPHATNSAGCTINVDSLGAKNLRSITGESISAGVLVAGTPYRISYFSSADEWILHNTISNPYVVPIGGMLDYVSSTPPNSAFVLPYGQAISRTTYAALYDICGTTFGTGDGATTFNVPDLRGRIRVGKDNMGGSTAGRVTSAGSGITGTTLGDTGGAETVTMARANMPNISLTDSIVVADHTHYVASSGGGTSALPSSATQIVREGRGNAVAGADYYYSLEGTNSAANVGLSSDDGGHTVNVSIALNGGVTQTAMNKMPPSIVLTQLLRVI
jgi:microcystin-dependent protein